MEIIRMHMVNLYIHKSHHYRAKLLEIKLLEEAKTKRKLICTYCHEFIHDIVLV